MRTTRLKITVKALMIVVALAGLSIFGLITAMRMSRRAKLFQSQASIWRQQEVRLATHLAFCQNQLDGLGRAASQLRAMSLNLYQPERLATNIAADTYGGGLTWLTPRRTSRIVQ
jgi:hypothetical protein